MKYRRSLFVFECLLGLSLLPALLGLGMARAQQLALRADLWCPYNCEPGAPEPGLMIELARAALPEAQIDYALGRWAPLRRQQSRPPQPVLVLLGVSDTPVSRRDLHVVRPAVGRAQTCAYRRKEDAGWQMRTPADLRGRRLSVTAGYLHPPELRALLAETGGRRRITEVRSERASLSHARMLALGRVEVSLEDRHVMQWGLRQLSEDQRAQIVEAGCLAPRESDALHFGLPLSDPRSADVAAALEQGLRRLQASGELSRLRQRYGLAP